MKQDFSKLDRLLRRFADEKSVPGCAMAIMQGDRIIYENYTGCADIASGKKVTAGSMFRQASTTKLFTYAILAMLYEEGEFLFSDPVGKYLPEWETSRKFVREPNGEYRIIPTEHPITIRQAVNMTCGLPYCMVAEPDSPNPTLAAMSRRLMALQEKGIPTLEEEVRAMSDVPLMFEPGSHWYYGFGSEIMGVLVEKLEDMPLREVFRKRIIQPMELEHADTYITDGNRDLVVTNYVKQDGVFSPAPRWLDDSADPKKAPVGSRPNLLISAGDFAAFMQMLANGGTYRGRKYLGEGTVQMLHENQLDGTLLKDFENDYLAGYGYGYGFRTLMTRKYGHNGHPGCFGWTGGSGIWAEADPVDRFSIVYMHNMIPNEELCHHHRVRAAAYGCML